MKRTAAGGGRGGFCPPPPKKGRPPFTPSAPTSAATTRGSWTLQSQVKDLRKPYPQFPIKAPRRLGSAIKAPSCLKAHLYSLNPHEDVGNGADRSHERRAQVNEKTNFSFAPFLSGDSDTSTPRTAPEGSGRGDLSNTSFAPWGPGWAAGCFAASTPSGR